MSHQEKASENHDDISKHINEVAKKKKLAIPCVAKDVEDMKLSYAAGKKQF